MIVIVGGGLAGLMLARVLARGGVAATVLDADASPDARHQGGMLNVNAGTGQDALALAGLLDAFRARALPGGDALLIRDQAGAARLADAGHGDRPEIERGALRALLAGSLPPGTIRWGAKVRSVARDGDGWALALADGEVVRASLVVGADGAWSRLRPLVSDARPVHSGIVFAELALDAGRHPEAAALVGSGLMFALGNGRAILAHREPDRLHAYAALPGPEDWHGTRADLHDAFGPWAEPWHRLIDAADDPLTVRPVQALPVGHAWRRTRGLTLIGDAAHLMSPFAGEGANLALADGANLGAALLAHADPEAALDAVEPAIQARAEAAARQTADNLAMMFAPDGLDQLLGFMERVRAA